MIWNIQYLVGKCYVFWDDLLDVIGLDQCFIVEDLVFIFDEVVWVICDEQLDLVLFQEIDDGFSVIDDQD